jgi:hypothetical protein
MDRKVTGWIMSHPRQPDPQCAPPARRDPGYLSELAAVQDHVTGFADLMTQGRGRDLGK